MGSKSSGPGHLRCLEGMSLGPTVLNSFLRRHVSGYFTLLKNRHE